MVYLTPTEQARNGMFKLISLSLLMSKPEQRVEAEGVEIKVSFQITAVEDTEMAEAAEVHTHTYTYIHTYVHTYTALVQVLFCITIIYTIIHHILHIHTNYAY
jgi:hypothetical protein